MFSSDETVIGSLRLVLMRLPLSRNVWYWRLQLSRKLVVLISHLVIGSQSVVLMKLSLGRHMCF